MRILSKTNQLGAIVLPLAIVALTGCMQASQTAGPKALDAETLGLSCTELADRNQKITIRLAELEEEQRAEDRKRAVTDTVVNIGLGAIVGAGAHGGLDGIRAATATVQGIQVVRSAEQGRAGFANVSDTLALASRSSELQRAIIEKGC